MISSLSFLNVGSALIIAVLIVFFVLSALAQLSRIVQLSTQPNQPLGRWKRVLVTNWLWNKWRAIPVFTFFAYTPEVEIHLMFRDMLSDQELTPWRLVHYECHQSLKWLWNPDRRRYKAVMELTGSLMMLLFGEQDPEFPSLFSWPPYIKLVAYTSGLPRATATTARQFLLVATPIPADSGPPEILFISPLRPTPKSLPDFST